MDEGPPGPPKSSSAQSYGYFKEADDPSEIGRCIPQDGCNPGGVLQNVWFRRPAARPFSEGRTISRPCGCRHVCLLVDCLAKTDLASERSVNPFCVPENTPEPLVFGRWKLCLGRVRKVCCMDRLAGHHPYRSFRPWLHLKLLFLSVFVTMVVAMWAPTKYGPNVRLSGGYIQTDARGEIYMRISRLGYVRYVYMGSTDEMEVPEQQIVSRSLPSWSLFYKGTTNWICTELASGWPLLCASCYWTVPDEGSTIPVIHDGIEEEPRRSAYLWGIWHAYPLRILWFRAIGNVMIYFAASVAFYHGFHGLYKRSIRRHRDRLGLCRLCGYKLDGAANIICPECGSTNGRD